MVQTLNRRDRVRAATTMEIKQTARRILVSEGPDAVSLRAIAREMGMTAPALYRYFGSHEELIKYVIADIFTELTADLQAAIAVAGAQRRRPDLEGHRGRPGVPALVAQSPAGVRHAVRHAAPRREHRA